MTYKFNFIKLTPRPWKNFDEFMISARKQCIYERLFPCPKCHGYGYVRRFSDCDIIEGYKMAPWHGCLECRASGEVDPSFYEKFYKITIKEWREGRDRDKEKLHEQKVVSYTASDYFGEDDLKILKDIL